MRTIDKGDEMPRVFEKVLRALETCEEQRIRTIAKAAGISAAYAHAIIRQLAAAGIITIHSDPGCRLDVSVNPRFRKPKQ